MKSKGVKVSAIIVAAGVGSRMGTSVPKQFVEVLGKPIIAYTINSVSMCVDVDEIIVVTNSDYLVYMKDIVDTFGFKKVKKIVCGGKSRPESVANGLKEVSKESIVVAVHDGARPMIDPDVFSECIKSAEKFGCAAVGVKMKDTVKMSDDNGFIEYTVNREKLWQIQTPQIFKKEIICSLYDFRDNNLTATDDCFLAEQAGYKVKLVEGKYENIKITTPQDIHIMTGLLGG